MKALAITPLYPPHSLVGSWLTTHEFLSHLAGRGHQVDVIPWCSDRDPVDLDGVHVHPKSVENITTLARQADVVICHVGDNGAAARLAASHQVPVVRMAHSPATRSRLEGAALVVWNSHSLMRVLLDDLDVVPAVAPLSLWSDPPDRYWDTWGHVGLDGAPFQHEPPYHPCTVEHLPTIRSAGSCFAVRPGLARLVRFSPVDCIRGVGRSIRDGGGSLHLDPRVAVRHP